MKNIRNTKNESITRALALGLGILGLLGQVRFVSAGQGGVSMRASMRAQSPRSPIGSIQGMSSHASSIASFSPHSVVSQASQHSTIAGQTPGRPQTRVQEVAASWSKNVPMAFDRFVQEPFAQVSPRLGLGTNGGPIGGPRSQSFTEAQNKFKFNQSEVDVIEPLPAMYRRKAVAIAPSRVSSASSSPLTQEALSQHTSSGFGRYAQSEGAFSVEPFIGPDFDRRSTAPSIAPSRVSSASSRKPRVSGRAGQTQMWDQENPVNIVVRHYPGTPEVGTPVQVAPRGAITLRAPVRPGGIKKRYLAAGAMGLAGLAGLAGFAGAELEDELDNDGGPRISITNENVDSDGNSKNQRCDKGQHLVRNDKGEYWCEDDKGSEDDTEESDDQGSRQTNSQNQNNSQVVNVWLHPDDNKQLPPQITVNTPDITVTTPVNVNIPPAPQDVTNVNVNTNVKPGGPQAPVQPQVLDQWWNDLSFR